VGRLEPIFPGSGLEVQAVFDKLKLWTVKGDSSNGWKFKPSRAAIVGELVLHFGLGVGLVSLGALGTPLIVRGHGEAVMVCAPFLILGAYLLYRGLRILRESSVPVIVERGGRILYGDRELCGPGDAEAVRLVRYPASEGEENWRVGVALADGRTVVLPSRYFFLFSCREGANRLAGALAGALGTEVSEDTVADGHFPNTIATMQETEPPENA
jgi:hypothetical protein